MDTHTCIHTYTLSFHLNYLNNHQIFYPERNCMIKESKGVVVCSHLPIIHLHALPPSRILAHKHAMRPPEQPISKDTLQN